MGAGGIIPKFSPDGGIEPLNLKARYAPWIWGGWYILPSQPFSGGGGGIAPPKM